MDQNKNHGPRHISEILLDWPGLKTTAWVNGGSPNKRPGERHKRGSRKVAPFHKKWHGGASNKTPNWVIKTNYLMKVSKQGDLFGEVEIILESPYLDECIKGLGADFGRACAHFESQVIQSMKDTLRKLISVYAYSKHQFHPISGQQVLERLEDAKRRITKRSRLEKAQSALEAIYVDLEAVLPNPNARTYPSQFKKVHLLYEFVDFDFSNWILN